MSKKFEITSAASEAEAIAAISAIEQFIRDFAPVQESEVTVGGWGKTALTEAVDREPAFGSSWSEL